MAKRYLGLMTWALFMALLSGCANFSVDNFSLRPIKPDERVKLWLDEHKYDHAIQYLDKIRPQSPNAELKAQLPAIQEQRQHYVLQTLALSDQQLAQALWADATHTVQDALKNLPDDPDLQGQMAIVEAERDQYIVDQEERILLAKGQYLLAKSPQMDAIINAHPDSFLRQQKYRDFQRDVRSVAKQLFLLGQSGIDSRNPERQAMASEALTVSHLLAPTPLSQELISRIEEERRQREKAKLEKEQAEYDRKLGLWQKSFDQALAADDLILARQALDSLRVLNPSLGILKDYQKALNSRAEEKVSSGIERGRILYSQGFIQEALNVWLDTQRVAPDNAILTDHIDRARKFLSNLDKLSN